MAGDAPSFTQRFAFVLARGCIPVRIDPFERRPGPELADNYPFPSLINWSRIVVPVDRNISAYEALVPRLLELEPNAHLVRQYMRNVAHWMLFDAGGQQQDAASAALFELMTRLGVHKT